MPSFEVILPELHAGQKRAFLLSEDARGGPWAKNAGGRFKVGRCGRRWGKSVFGATWICDGAAGGEPTAWFAPDYKTSIEVYNDIYDILEPIKRGSSKTDGVIRTLTGGRVDFWTLDNERAGRSRKYKRVVIDEAAFTKPNMMEIWERSIKPTLLDMQGEAMVLSNTNGVDSENFLWRICNQPEHGFIEFSAPSWDNPTIPARLPGESDESWEARRDAIFDELRQREHPLVFRQEYAAEFVDWSGVAFFDLAKFLDPPDMAVGKPVPVPNKCDSVFAVMDTAIKTGTDNDGTAVIWFARSQHYGYPLVILDWDIYQIEGQFLESYAPAVLQRSEELARQTNATYGAIGLFIEDKATGQVLIQKGQRLGWPVEAIDSKLTAVGKDERALLVSNHHYQGKCKISQPAYEKVTQYKSTSRNHLISQVTGFRLGDKDAARRADDLLDCYTYGLAIALGNSEGF